MCSILIESAVDGLKLTSSHNKSSDDDVFPVCVRFSVPADRLMEIGASIEKLRVLQLFGKDKFIENLNFTDKELEEYTNTSDVMKDLQFFKLFNSSFIRKKL